MESAVDSIIQRTITLRREFRLTELINDNVKKITLNNYYEIMS